MSRLVRIGTRSSKLALAQVAEVYLSLSSYSNIKLEVVPIKTSGDIHHSVKLAEIGGKGLFVKELEQALLDNKIDIAVHSSKDLPSILHHQTILAAITQNNNHFDALISNHKIKSLSDLPIGVTIATSSPRRSAFLKKLLPTAKIIDLRGNIDTRIKKLQEKSFDAIVLAMAGLNRISQDHLVQYVFNENEILPATGQGCLALQTRTDDLEIQQIANLVNHNESNICFTAEREFSLSMQGSCLTPMASFAIINNQELTLKTAIISPCGSEYNFQQISTCQISHVEAKRIGNNLANKTKLEASSLWQKISI
jgi:hydroxymethylbilane synthase